MPTRLVSFFSMIRSMDRRILAVIVVIVLIALCAPFLFRTRVSDTSAAEATPHVVALIDTSAYAANSTSTSAQTQEFVVRAEVGGKVVSVAQTGARVSSGDVIAQLDNAAQKAALLQAEGSLGVAQASEAKTKAGLRTEQVSIRTTSLDSAKSTGVNALLSAYASVDSALKSSADQMFTPPVNNSSPTFTIELKNTSYKYQIEQARFTLDDVLARESAAGDTVTADSDLASELTTTADEVRGALDFVQLILTATADAIPTNSVSASTISAYRATMVSARASLNAALSSLASAKGGLSTAQASLQEGVSYTQNTDLDSASASVKQAQGAYQAALAAYNKTIVRANATGRVISCSVEPGDIASVGADICRISGVGGSDSAAFQLPLSAVKYTPDGASVFVIDGDGTLKAIPVQTGLVSADAVSVTGPIAGERIVQDVRGLREGDTVTIAQ